MMVREGVVVSAAANTKIESGKKRGKGRPVNKDIRVKEISVGARIREIRPNKVASLAISMQASGLNTPITVRASSTAAKPGSKPWALVAGAHRLAAARQLEWTTIRCEIFTGNEDEAKSWEIRENLDRAELTVLERAEHIAQLKRLIEKDVSAQVAPKPRGGRPARGVRADARALGLERTELDRALKIADISLVAKAAIKAANLDDNQKALLRIAREKTEQAQVAKVSEIARGGLAKWPARGNAKTEEVRGGRRTNYQAMVALAAKHLGRHADRFAQLARELGEPELIRFALAVRDWHSSHGASNGANRDRSGLQKAPSLLP
jgi:ParB-like chromosome segregation protein Spo0J